MSKKYIIDGGVDGSERLKKLAESTWDTTKFYLSKTGIKEGMSVLDAGCGNGLITRNIRDIVGKNTDFWAIDFDGEIIEIAKKLNPDSNINFFKFDLSKNDLDVKEKFDFIFSRFLLSHVNNPNEVLDKFKNMLKEGGLLYIEDVDFSGYFSYPVNDAFNKYVESYEKLASQKGGDARLGLKLNEMFENKKFKNIEIYSSMGCFKEGVGKEIAYITYKSISKALIEAGYTTKEETEQIISDLESFTKQDNSILSLPRLFHCFGNK